MRAKDLRKYKTLDITELSGSPWNDAEKVLGLDQDDKVIMAEPEETVTPEYVDEAIAEATEDLPTKNWVVGHCDLAISAATADFASNEYVDDAINQAMEAETARTEDVYAKKSEVPDLDDYYTKEEVDEAISGITVDLSNYYTKDETDQAISAATQDLASTDYVDDAIANETARTESTYLKQSDIEDDQFPTKNWVKGHTALAIEHSMEVETARTESVYAKKSEIPSLDGYAKTTAVTEDIQTAISNETARTESTYLKEHQSLDNYYTKDQVDAEITGATEGLASEQYVNDAIAAIPAVDLSPYAKTTAVTQDIQTAMAAETARTESTYLKEHQSLDNYYNKGEVDAKFVSAATEVGNAIDAAVQGLASETYVDNAVAGLASEDYVDDAVSAATEGMATQSDLEGLASETYVDDAVNGVVQGIGMLGMVNDVSEDDGTVTVQKTTMQEGQLVTGSTSFNIATPGDIQTAIASETARTESTYLKEHQSLDNYYTKSQVDAEITGATEGLASEQYVDDAIATAITIDSALSSSSTNPVENRVITNALDSLSEQIPVVDSAVTSASTNAVESQAVYSELYTTSSTQLEASTAVTEYSFTYRLVSSQSSVFNRTGYFRETNLPGYYAFYLEDLTDTGLTYDWYVLTILGVNIQSANKFSDSYSVETENLGSPMYFSTEGTGTVAIISNPNDGHLDGTMKYWFVIDTNSGTAYVYKTLPAVTVVVDRFATREYVDAAVTAATENLATEQYVDDAIAAIPEPDLSDYYTKEEVDAEITGATEDMATKTWVGQQGYLTQHQDISGKLDKTDFNTYTGATETALAEKLDASAYTVDNAIDSASTNPVENRAVYDALYGESASTQLEIIESATTSVYLSASNIGNIYFKETNMPDYLAINLGEYITGNTYFNQINDGTSKRFDVVSYGWDVTLAKLGVKCFLDGSGNLSFNSSNLDGTYNYYLVYNQVDDYVVVYKNLPVITEVTDHSANISDIPVAQDSSDTKYYAYSGDNFKKIISNVYPGVSTNTPDSGATRRVDSTISYTVWNSNESQQTEGYPIPTGNEYYPGLKTSRDSEVIDNAMEALSGLTESITLTLGNQSTDYITLIGQNYYLFETDNPRYLAIPASGASRFSICGFDKIVLSNTDYYSLNSSSDMANDLTGVYQLATYKNRLVGNHQKLKMFMEGKYFIIDKELKLFIVSDSLTFTRAKNIPEAISAATQGMVTSGDVATQITTALTGYATEQWVQNQGYLTQHQSLANYYTKTEIDGMIGDIETLLASI